MALFFRDGREVTTKVETGTRGPFVYVTEKCSRCGGAGGWTGWPGFTCYGCGGRRTFTKPTPVYTAEKLAKLNTAADKRHAKKAAAREVAREAAKAAAAATRSAMLAEHGMLIERAKAVAPENSWLAGFVASILERGSMTPRMLEALTTATEREEAEAARKATAHYLGEVGKRIDINVTLKKVILVSHHHIYGSKYANILHAADGSKVTYFGKPLGEEGARFSLRATVSEHREYRGEPETVVKRPVMKEAA